jgi:hypothetical protein
LQMEVKVFKVMIISAKQLSYNVFIDIDSKL